MADQQQQNAQAQIQQLYAQMQQIQQQYVQYDTAYKSAKTDPLQKPSIQQKMQQLTAQYNEISQQLEVLKTPPQEQQHVVKPTTKSTWSSFDPKTLAIGCGTIFLLLVWWLAGVFYYLIHNPQQLNSFWVDAGTAKTLLQTFSSLFFGLVSFGLFALLIVNAYRLFTIKNTSKLRYVLWTIFSFIFFVLWLAVWYSVANSVANISADDLLNPNALLKPYVILKDEVKYFWNDPTFLLIAPTALNYALNASLFTTQVVPTLWASVTVQSVTLDCWNKQQIPLDATSTDESIPFLGMCLYTEKGNYPLILKVTYVDTQTSEQLAKDISAWSLTIKTAIKVSLNKWNIQYTPNELVVGKIPAKVTFDASDVFKDLALPNYKVVWDVDGDGSSDSADQANFTYIYKKAQAYVVVVRFPELNDYMYAFPLRAEQSDVPVCEIATQQIKWNEYSITTSFLDGNPQISEYQFSIVDRVKKRTIETFKNTNWTLQYLFPWLGTYAIQVAYVTTDGKQGEAESEDIQIGSSDFNVLYSLSLKSPTSPTFKTVTLTWGELIISELPSIVRLDITNITPNTAGVVKKVFVDGVAVVSTTSLFEMTFDESKDYAVSVVVEDPNRNMRTEKNFVVGVNRADILWSLLVKPDTVWTSPFTVKFDASSTTVYDDADEIIYFTWDFWDGEVKTNISQSIITHVYKYDFANENGQYYPIVTVKTKKWREIQVGSWTMIVVKKPVNDLVIHIDSHPGQRASAGDVVQMSLELDGLPTKILWDFWNNQTLECTQRQCVDTSKVYTTPGTYLIKAQAIFEENLTVEWSITLLVE